MAISNRRLVGFDAAGVDVRTRDYRRIRHYGLLASAARRANLTRIWDLLATPSPAIPPESAPLPDRLTPCPCCGSRPE